MNQKEKIFNPTHYFQQYYATPEGHQEEQLCTLFQKWRVEAFEIVPQCQLGVEIGAGPVLLLAAVASRKVKKQIITDYNTQCFSALQESIQHSSSHNFNLTEHFKIIQSLQKSKEDIGERLRKSVLLCLKIDLKSKNVFEYPLLQKVDIITSCLCIEAVSDTIVEYSSIIGNLTAHLKPKGFLFMYGVLEQTFYMVGEQKLPCLSLDEKSIQQTLNENGFDILQFKSERTQSPPSVTSNFKGIYAVLAQLK